MKPTLSTSRLIAAASLVLALALAAWLAWHARESDIPTTASTDEPVAPVAPDAAPAIDLNDPPESFDTFLHVQHTGGCRLTRAAAIGWLDVHSRERRPLPTEEAHHVMDALRSGGHDAWTPGYRQHLYNSAFNALHLCDVAEDLTQLFHHFARHDDDRVMRLYALQHIGVQRSAGHLTGTLADEIHATLVAFANDTESDVSGTAIALLADWDGVEGDPPEAIQAIAAATAADRSRPVDVRVSAIHAAGPASLEVARTIAPDVTEPVILRKAAIARIGRHGGEGDLTALGELQSENTRIAQATTPARQSIQDRVAGRTRPDPIPYPSSTTH